MKIERLDHPVRDIGAGRKALSFGIRKIKQHRYLYIVTPTRCANEFAPTFVTLIRCANEFAPTFVTLIQCANEFAPTCRAEFIRPAKLERA
ncbi:MAG: hypothetical protein ACYC05_02655 [Sulfuricella sp.]